MRGFGGREEGSGPVDGDQPTSSRTLRCEAALWQHGHEEADVRRWTSALLICVVVVALCSLLAACGDSVAGDYTYVSGDDAMKGATLSLTGDGELEMTVPGEYGGTVKGTYEVEGDKVTLVSAAGASEPGTYKDGTLTLEGVTWRKK